MILFAAGYGYITPQTPAGKILCIFVSLFGIPITMLALKSIGELIAKGINKIVTKFEKKILKRSEPKYVKPKSAVILFTLVVLLIVVNGLAITTHLNDWTIVEGVYFWFITFTTIGFGDYHLRQPQRIRQLSVNISTNKSVNQENKHVSGAALAGMHVFFTSYYIICLCIVSSVLNSIMSVIAERKCCRRCPGCVPRKTQHHVYNEQGGNQNVCEPVVLTYFRIDNVRFQKENIESSPQ